MNLHLLRQVLLHALLCLLVFAMLTGCGANYNGPTVSRVGVTGAYTDRDGETYAGGVNADLAYPLPAARRVKPSPK